MARKPTRPSRFHVGAVSARAVRGPHKTDSTSWYWIATAEQAGQRWTVWAGWGTTKQAQASLVALLAANDGNVPFPTPKDTQASQSQAAPIATVLDLMETFAARQEARYQAGDLTKYGWRNSQGDCNHLRQELGKVLLDRLGLKDIEAFRNSQLIAGVASSSVHRQLKTLRTAWAWGREVGVCPAVDLPKVGVKVVAVRDKHTPSHADVEAVIQTMREGSWFRFVTALLAETGARVGEIAELDWSAIDWRAETMTLTGKGDARLFPITPEIRAILDRAPNQGPSGFLHGTTVSMVRGHFSSRELVRACERAGVKRFSAHGLRRAAVDTLARSGVDIGTAADLIGHSPEVMLRAYRQVSEADRRGAAAALGKARKDGAREAKVIPITRGAK